MGGFLMTTKFTRAKTDHTCLEWQTWPKTALWVSALNNQQSNERLTHADIRKRGIKKMTKLH